MRSCPASRRQFLSHSLVSKRDTLIELLIDILGHMQKNIIDLHVVYDIFKLLFG